MSLNIHALQATAHATAHAAMRTATAVLLMSPVLALAQANCGLPGLPPCPIPEPGSLWLVGLAVVLIGVVGPIARK